MDEYRVERILRCCEAIPEGRIASYSLIGRIADAPARLVGRVMAEYGAQVPWWRVTNVAGKLPAELYRRATPHWDAEAVAHSGGRVNVRAHLVDESELAAAYADRMKSLGPGTDEHALD